MKNIAGIVTPSEMRTAHDWVQHALDALQRLQIHVQCLAQGWGPFLLGRSVNDEPIRLKGQEFALGFGTHADSEILLELPTPGMRFQALCGVDDNRDTRGKNVKIVFSIEADGREVWRSGVQTESMSPARADVDISGARRVLLRAIGPGGIGSAHADWANPRVTLIDGTETHLGRQDSTRACPCFEFTYAGKPSSEFLHGWRLQKESTQLGRGKMLDRITWTDPNTLLQVVMEMTSYSDFPVAEWVLRFRNNSAEPTPILEDIHSMTMSLPLGSGLRLNYHNGDDQTPYSYEPFQVQLRNGMSLDFASEGGRPTNHSYPYYNIEGPQGRGGVILAIGWPGQWASRFEVNATDLRVQAGQERTHFRLLPGEEVRTPLSVVLLYEGSRTRSQNVWRRWMLEHNVPRSNGELPKPISIMCMGLRQNEKDEKGYIDAFLAHGATFDYWWMDAGWYETIKPEWPGVGTWEVDRTRFPNGVRAVSDYARSKGMKFVLWFEPERVTPDTWLEKNHPDWLLSAPSGGAKLLNLGHPEAWKWAVEHIDGLICSEGVDLYRQDFNMDPLDLWRANDAPDRQGITEIRHVEGYLAFWDELRRRHPEKFIDSCASGGRRNDLETLRRALPLLRSDYQFVGTGDVLEFARGNQGHTYGLSMWVPYSGTGVTIESTYAARSHFTPSLGLGGGDPNKPEFNWAQHRRLTEEWRRVAKYFLGDFYPLTPSSRDAGAFIAWQFHRDDLNEGVIQVFRRSQCAFVAAQFLLSGLDAETTYTFEWLNEGGKTIRMTGQEAMEKGLFVEMPEQPSSSIIVYERASCSRTP